MWENRHYLKPVEKFLIKFGQALSINKFSKRLTLNSRSFFLRIFLLNFYILFYFRRTGGVFEFVDMYAILQLQSDRL